MGGFAGGDEGGYWDVEVPLVLTENKNNTLKETFPVETKNSSYHIKVPIEDGRYDTIRCIPRESSGFTIKGCSEDSTESQVLLKAYEALHSYVVDSDMEEFFSEHILVLEKDVSIKRCKPSKYALAFMLLSKEACNLIVSSQELEKLSNSLITD